MGNMELVIAVLVGAAIGLAFGWMRAKNLLAGAVSRAHYDALAEEKITLAAKREAANDRIDALSDELEQLKRDKTALHERALKSEAQAHALEDKLKEQQEQLRLEFNNTATALLEKIGTQFTAQSEKKIGELLNPMRERLTDFQKLVVDSFTTQGKEQHTLKSEIEKIVLQTDSLTKALRGDVKAQGNWGEVMLERILEESALRKGEDYFVQAAEMGLTGADGNRLKPDVIVRLPEDKHIIIDAKVSLTAYERYCAEADELARGVHLKEFIRSVKNHVAGLEQKRYQDIEKLGTPDFVLMFMPIEGAYSLAVQSDPELHGYAWGRKIVIVCPATLFATLRTIASLWRIETQNRHAHEIARQGGVLYDKFIGFVEDMQAIDLHLGRAHESHTKAMNKLNTGRGNIVIGMEKLKQLGIKSSKSLPKELQGLESDIEALEEG